VSRLGRFDLAHVDPNESNFDAYDQGITRQVWLKSARPDSGLVARNAGNSRRRVSTETK
jgi:hypothetical protein